MSRIIAAHSMIHSANPDADRDFLRDVLQLDNVDAGGGFLIFGLPAAELHVHPSPRNDVHELYLMCDDVHATVEELEAKGVEFTQRVSDEGFGLVTALVLPGGGELGLYEPRHPTPR
jgi:hypothetical protein